jgi:hypothetical protein
VIAPPISLPRFPRREILAMLAALGLLIWQVLLPGFIGLANNGDFPKIAGRLSLSPAGGDGDNFVYFEPNYLRAPRFYWNAELPSSELAVAWVASKAAAKTQERLRDPHTFDIRWLGAVHALIWLAGFSLLFRLIRPLEGIPWWIAAIASLWIFMDVAYVAYFNSFYTDAAALVGAMAAVSLTPVLIGRIKAARVGAIVLFGAGALLYVTSKGQHALFGPLPAALLCVIGWKTVHGKAKVAAFVTAAVVLCGSAWTFGETPYWYKSQPRFNLIFARILPESADRARDVRELGLDSADLQYVGMHSFRPGTPVENVTWLRDFSQRSSYMAVLRFYLHHPSMPIGFLWSDLRLQASQIRPENLSNYSRRDGHPPGALTNRMASWSNLRRYAAARWPIHLVIWYGLLLVVLPALAQRRPTALAAMFAALLGMGEFLIASLTDCLETYRHLLLFQLFTDFTIFFAIVLVLQVYSRWRIDAAAARPVRMQSGSPMPS